MVILFLQVTRSNNHAKSICLTLFGAIMKKAMILLDNFDSTQFHKRYDIGVISTHKLYKLNKLAYKVYELDEDSSYKLEIGLNNDDALIAHDANTKEFFKVCEGVQNSLYLLFCAI
jgi:hypothetical protein